MLVRRNRSGQRVVLAFALVAAMTMPAFAQAGPPPGAPPLDGGSPGQPQVLPRKKHHSGVGAAIGAGVLGGIVGGAILGSQGQAQPGYPPPQPEYAPPPPPPPAYDADADGYDEPVCHIVRKPVYDEDGQIVDYRTRRVCR